jgi:hypothetical protein
MTEDQLYTYENIEKKFATTSFDPAPYLKSTLVDCSLREKLIANVIDGSNHINYYFNSYLIIREASAINPALFYSYWEEFWQLHNHKNSYHRRIAHDLITNLSSCDQENKFPDIKNDYLAMIISEKISNLLAMFTNAHHVNQITSQELSSLAEELKSQPHLTEKQRIRIQKLHQELTNH